ncbi:MAG: hypothetical protein C5B51_29530 [Terriglobia bacterium]|nr:MAG: hypothetical protein C5B51_29530 [Terriglobia bacterium]
MRLFLCLGLLLSSTVVCAQDWGPLQFLVGRWTGEGTGVPGEASGGFSFAPHLQGKILVRKNFADYPPAAGKPGFRHDDLMVVYRDESQRLRAMYFDNEGHVISYTVKPIESGGVVLESEGPQNVTRYRMTYRASSADRVRIGFEIAPPGKDFAGYIEATARRERTVVPR